MLAELEIIPVGTRSASVGPLVSKIIDLVDKSGLEYRAGPMGTVVEGSWDEVMSLARRCHEALLASCDRVITTIRLDDRKDKTGPRIEQKVASMEKTLGRRLRR